jgi:activator of HSP90 ATPase
MKSLRKKYLINAPSGKVWIALVDPKEIKEWTGSTARMDEKVGSRFKLWDGDIYGKNKEIIKNKKIVQEWYAGKWKEPSIATIEISGKDGKSKIELKQVNVPDDEFDGINRGWDDYYFLPLKEYLESSE